MSSITVPAIGIFDVNGTATVEAANAQSFSFTTPADMTFSGTISAASLKSAFDVSGDSDNTLSLEVSVTDGAALANALSAAMQAATSDAPGESNANDYNAAPSGSLLSAYLMNIAQHGLDGDLGQDGIANALSAAQVGELALDDLDEDCDTGAADLVGNIDATHAKTIALQLPHSRWIAEAGADSAQLNYIPFLAGDNITFRFYITQTYSVTSKAVAVAGSAASASTANDSVEVTSGAVQGSQPAVGAEAVFSVPSKIVDFVLTLS
jgi:hypothetical protein